MNPQAFFIDMDGTLLNASNRISLRNMKAIRRLMEQGTRVFLATGRHYEITAPYHKEIGLQTPMICLNGAAIHDGETGRAIQTKTVRLNDARFHELTAGISCNVMIHTADGLYCKETNEEIDYWTKVGNMPPRYIGDVSQANYRDVLKYSVRTGAPCPEFSALFKEEAAVIDWDDGFEMVAPHTSKWTAIKSLLAEYRIRPSEAVAIGDGPNDMEMLEHIGFSAAMGNASEQVKAVADYVTGHHDDDGFADFINDYLLSHQRAVSF